MQPYSIGIGLGRFPKMGGGDGNGGQLPEPPAGTAYVISANGAYAVNATGGAYVLARIDNG